MNNCIEVSDKNFMPVYSRYQIAIEKGDGVYLYDNEGKKYLDFAAGIAVFALGYKIGRASCRERVSSPV